MRAGAPQSALPWEGIKNTTKFAPAAFQGGYPPSGKSEDCLYLNVWTPVASAEEQLPVLVWIYGGGFSFGSTAEPVYSGEKLAKKGVVFVSLAYRVGQLGFLAHPELRDESPDQISGNYGLLDLIAGLEWIQKNIAAFGGDPGKVTIFGESAGGIAVSMLHASPRAKGLFHGAISQSGGSFGPPRPTTYPGENMKFMADAERDGLAWMESNGASSISDLRAMDADSLVMGFGLGSAWPIIDGVVIPDDQYNLYEKGAFLDTPVLIGYNSDEGLSFTGTDNPEAHLASVRERYGIFAEDLTKAYPAGKTHLPKTARDLARDASFGWHTWSWARLQAWNGTSSVYYYYFDQHPEYPEDSPQHGHGSPHGQEIPYVFMHLDPEDARTTSSDVALSEIMATYWTNFAKTGNPNGEGVPEWPSFREDRPEVMYLTGPEPHVGPVPDAGSLEVLDAYFRWRRSPEGSAWAH
ncbi:MAG: carboxylesterase family protein [Bacteroidales bacterium]